MALFQSWSLQTAKLPVLIVWRNLTRILVFTVVLTVLAVILVSLGKGRDFSALHWASYVRRSRIRPNGSDVRKTSAQLLLATDILGAKSQESSAHVMSGRWGPMFGERDPLNNSGAVDVSAFLQGRKEPERRHVFFLKVHKAASTTMQTMLLRFAYVRNLSLMLPQWGSAINQHSTTFKGLLLPSSGPDPSVYDILCSHVIYSPRLLSDFLHEDTVSIAIVRDPFQQFVSAFKYYSNLPYLRVVRSSNPISKFLRERVKFELKPRASFTNQRLTVDFGYDPADFGNMTKFHEYLRKMDMDFQLVMVVELFDQSLILLRRLLHWQWKDILFLPMNKGGVEIPYEATDEDIQLYRNWTTLDYPLYNHFLVKLERILSRMPKEFFLEVDAYRKCREKVEEGCSRVRGRGSRVVTSQPVSMWSGPFTVTEEDCFLLKQPEVEMTNLARNKQKERLALKKRLQTIGDHKQ